MPKKTVTLGRAYSDKDDIGRLTVTKKVLAGSSFEFGDEFEITTDGDKIVFTKIKS